MNDVSRRVARIAWLTARNVEREHARRLEIAEARRIDEAVAPTPDGESDDFDPSSVPRPRTRADCGPGGCNEVRPCPFVSCRAHLALDVRGRTVVMPREIDDLCSMRDTCALDVADRGEATLEEIGELLGIGVSRERARQIEDAALRHMRLAMRVLLGETGLKPPPPKLCWRCKERAIEPGGTMCLSCKRTYAHNYHQRRNGAR